MKHIHFIVNPIAGKGNGTFDENMLSNYFSTDDIMIDVKKSEYPGHATLLAKQAVDTGADVVVACGGDGTINEVASCLVQTNVKLGIIPIGSGNGLAESLKIPRSIERALDIIQHQSEQHIDVAMVNGKPFFSNMGFGFDAKVISYYNASGHRRIWSYLRAFFKSLRSFERESTMHVQMNGKSIKTQPFMFFISNSKIMGYDISLTRKASLQDGLLDVVIIDNVGKAQILFIGLLVVLRLNRFLKKLKYYKTKELKIAFEDKVSGHLMQTDGELHKLTDKEVLVNIQQGALKVLCP